MATVKQYNDLREKEKIAYQFFLQKGYTKEQALGIVGNLIHESGLRTSAVGDKNLKHNAYGVAQWRMERFDRLKSKYGNDWDKFENQLEFVDWELNNTHKNTGKLLKSAKNAHEAGQIFSDEFERPKLKYGQDKNRRTAVASLASRLEGVNLKDVNINSQETFLPKKQESSIFANDYAVVLPEFATLPEAEKEETPKEKPTEEVLREKQAEKDYNRFQLQQQIVQQEEVPYVEAPNLNAIDFYNQANQIISAQEGGVITDNRGQWAHPGKVTRIISPNITMQDVNYPVLGVSEQTGEQKLMLPNLNYYFNNTKSVLEIPLKNGQK